MVAGLDPHIQRDTERWFLHRGIPHFIDRYNAAEDVFTRALPVLSLAFMAEFVAAADTEWDWWHNLLAMAGGFVLLVGMYSAFNILRGRRPLQRPNDVGTPELIAFVTIPALLPLIIGGRWRTAMLTVVVNIVVLIVVYVILLYGLIPTARWALSHMFRQLGGVGRLMARSLPLVLVFSMFIFLNAEIWQVAADFTGTYFGISVGVLLGIASVFVLFRLPREVDSLRRFRSWEEVASQLSDAPLEPEDCEGLEGKPDPPSLTRADWLNVGMVWWFSQLVQVLLVGAVIAAFYILFGVFTVREATILQWTENGSVSGWDISGTDLTVTWELVTVAGFIGAFSALQFAISAVTDETYREEFLGELVHDVREAFAVRAVYLARLGVTVSR
ncbi:MAG: hypothetical protein GY708_11560 [Actinomycetia bacterium]|nr:hypothetical protein [Actinomycetes bacterium]MCP4959372.1 hypothetical protein [Actinomycetes bacterium]